MLTLRESAKGPKAVKKTDPGCIRPHWQDLHLHIGFMMMRGDLLARLLVVCLVGAALAVEDVKFETLDPAAINQVVIMYRAGEEASDAALAAVEGAETLVKKAGGKAEGIAFRRCNAGDESNAPGMAAKGLNVFPMVFVSVEGQGMDRYMRELEASKISDFVLTKLEPSTDEDVFPYSDELISEEYPVFVKFSESWCSRCLAMKAAFEQSATKFVGRVMFMEVECSSSDEANAFCAKHQVDGYPTLKLLGGKFKTAVDFDRDRSVQGFTEFLEHHVPEEEPVGADSDAKAELR